jgi:hypothetical protein
MDRKHFVKYLVKYLHKPDMKDNLIFNHCSIYLWLYYVRTKYTNLVIFPPPSFKKKGCVWGGGGGLLIGNETLKNNFIFKI